MAFTRTPASCASTSSAPLFTLPEDIGTQLPTKRCPPLGSVLAGRVVSVKVLSHEAEIPTPTGIPLVASMPVAGTPKYLPPLTLPLKDTSFFEPESVPLAPRARGDLTPSSRPLAAGASARVLTARTCPLTAPFAPFDLTKERAKERIFVKPPVVPPTPSTSPTTIRTTTHTSVATQAGHFPSVPPSAPFLPKVSLFK